MAAAAITELYLQAFKSHRTQALRIEPLTLLVGKNGSGKSNALDALTLLALLADERDVGDLERGDREVAGLRGGLSGAAPFLSEPIVHVGCRVVDPDGGSFLYAIKLDAGDSPEIINERLQEQRSGRRSRVLIDSQRIDPGSGISEVRVYSSGAPKTYQFLASRLAITQATSRVAEDSQARRRVVAACRAVVSVLRGVFVLDPVPAEMRTYVPVGSQPDRWGSTVSALVYRLRDDRDAWDRLMALVRGLLEVGVRDITFLEGGLPHARPEDVMMALVEQAGSNDFKVPARLMSDGTLRYLAIVSALLTLPSMRSPSLGDVQRTLVVEEIENSLFPSQAARVLDLLKEEARRHGIRLVATTHSPALLDALRPEDHEGVVVCHRTPDGGSVLSRLVEHHSYVDLAGGGAIGRAVTAGLLESSAASKDKPLSDLFVA